MPGELVLNLWLVLHGDELVYVARSKAEANGRIGVSVRSKATEKDGLRIEAVSVSVPVSGSPVS